MERPKVEVAIEQVTPALAEEFLRSGDRNRRLSPSVADRYAETMTDGGWRFTHQGLAFDTEGRLQDGQHRCWAILKSGRPQWLLIVRGLDPDIFTVLDIGRKRTGGDAVHVAGVADHHENTIAGAARLLALLEKVGPATWSGSGASLTVPHPDLLLTIEKHPSIMEVLQDAERIRRAVGKAATPSAITASLALIREADLEGEVYGHSSKGSRAVPISRPETRVSLYGHAGRIWQRIAPPGPRSTGRTSSSSSRRGTHTSRSDL